MADAPLEFIRGELAETFEVTKAAVESAEFINQTVQIAATIADCLDAGGKVLLAGNGGSAGDAQHIAGELVSRLNYDRAPLAALALTTDTSILTAVGNDYGYDQVFTRQVAGLGRPGDVFIGITTSGRSPNVLRACEVARDKGLTTIGFVGSDPGSMGALCDLLLNAPSCRTPMIQQVHMIAAHIICGLVERQLFPRNHA
jgi:D-sedoheptulose 7-phosphate isomerase